MTDEHTLAFEDFVGRSIARPGVSNFFDATGIRLHYLEWPGPPGAPVLLLVHGFLGNAHWWDFVAPWLAENYRVIAMDFGGMGDSGYREEYVHATFVEEIRAVIEHLKIAPCTV
ncbi:MAG: alpha/beta fold hydrolase, partial [Steroidobacteraceae bacterium]